MELPEEKIAALQKIVMSSENIVFFGGAGVSTESGIPDFRSADGLYAQQYDVPPEQIISHSYFLSNPEKFYAFYKKKMVFLKARPNAAHLALAELEKASRLRAVITQNIDGLHQMAGSREVIELHGTVHKNLCMRCGKQYSAEEVLAMPGVPRCCCGGVIKPAVTLYEEALPEGAMERAAAFVRRAEVLIVGGTSLSVWPAAGLLSYFQGKSLVVLNTSPTSADKNADLLIAAPIGKVLGSLEIRPV